MLIVGSLIFYIMNISIFLITIAFFIIKVTSNEECMIWLIERK